MNIRDIEYILSAAEEGSFAKAAKVCNVSQPSLSIQIKKVEDRLGTHLFIREKRGVRLSEFGESIRPQLETVLQAVSDIERRAEIELDKPKEPLRLGAIATVAPYIFPYIRDIENIAFEESTTAALIKQLLDEEIDAALLALPIQVPQLTSLSLFKEPLLLAAAEDNVRAEEMNVDTMEPPTGSRFLVLYDEHCLGEQTLNLCKLDHQIGNKVFRATSLETIRHMVATSEDITLMPALARRKSDGLVYYDLPDRYYRTIGIVYKGRNQNTPAIQTLSNKIKSLELGDKV